MDDLFYKQELAVGPAVIKVIGVGGGGCNAINNMIENPIAGVDYISANTDAQSLQNNQAEQKIQLGAGLTRGLGAGANPEIGRNAALEDGETIRQAIEGADMLFITTGMGGGTGTGASPVIAQIARDMGILTVGVVTRPFKHEGKRIAVAQQGIDALKKEVDSLIVVPNDKLLSALGKGVTLKEAFRAANNVLRNAVAGISEIVTSPGLINVDFADVRTVMGITGMAMMGIGEGTGPERARQAVQQAISSPLLDDIDLGGAKGVLVNIATAPDCLILDEYEEIAEVVSQYAAADADLKYGTTEDPTLDENAIRVTIIATGLKEQGGLRGGHAARGQYGAEKAQAEGGMGRLLRSGRESRGVNLVAADFSSQSVLDDFETPAVLRRQNLFND